MSIKGKILFWFLLPTILIGIVAYGIGYYSIHKTVRQNIFDQLVIAADELQGNIRVFLQEKKGRIIDFSSDGCIKDGTEEITKRDDRVRYNTELLNTHLAKNKLPIDTDILEMFIVDLDGNVISSTEINRIGQNVSSEVYFSKTVKRGSSISDLHYSPEFNQNTFEVARLITSKNIYKKVGILVNRYKGDSLRKATRSGISEEFRELMKQEGLGETGELYIVNSDKLMITESRFVKDAILKQVVATDGVRTTFDNGMGMIGIYPDYRGIPVLGVSRYFEEMDWVILAEKDVSEAFAPIVRLRNIGIIIAITGITVIVTIAVFLSTRVTRPIKKLVETAHTIAEGNLNEEIKVKSKDEIGSLASSFDTMRIGLGKLLKNIEETKEDRRWSG
ncbi:MAG: two-component sensor kinase [Candidatus Scalindua rubra]|uniref:histidine kinase n=1 Tax=Candidatus Scalindua rubra TaxID=1872076 RepID=A0A1E3X6J8_9BACT|nr:MAG: two-component sensor kinase [Candidatus Scalindua rubra]